jgi:hypothetical protein
MSRILEEHQGKRIELNGNNLRLEPIGNTVLQTPHLAEIFTRELRRLALYVDRFGQQKQPCIPAKQLSCLVSPEIRFYRKCEADVKYVFCHGYSIARSEISSRLSAIYNNFPSASTKDGAIERILLKDWDHTAHICRKETWRNLPSSSEIGAGVNVRGCLPGLENMVRLFLDDDADRNAKTGNGKIPADFIRRSSIHKIFRSIQRRFSCKRPYYGLCILV